MLSGENERTPNEIEINGCDNLCLNSREFQLKDK